MNKTNALVKYFEGQPVNIITREGEPWFKANDLHGRLGYEDPSVTHVLDLHVDS